MSPKKIIKEVKKSAGYRGAVLKLWLKTADNVSSIKFYILLIATVFLYIGKIEPGTWQETVLTIAGFRVVNEVAAMFKKDPQPKPESEEPKDG